MDSSKPGITDQPDSGGSSNDSERRWPGVKWSEVYRASWGIVSIWGTMKVEKVYGDACRHDERGSR